MSRWRRCEGGERFPKGAQLLLIHEGNAEPLVPGFAASADASVSFDGGSVLFAGKKAADDPWQIWELTLADRTVRQVTSGSSDDAIRPLYMPGWRLVYAQRTPQGFQLRVGAARWSRRHSTRLNRLGRRRVFR